MDQKQKVFTLPVFDNSAKDLDIECSAGYLRLYVDWDDVNHYETATLLEKVLAILNDHWNDPEYTSFGPEPLEQEGLTDDETGAAWEARYTAAKEIMQHIAEGRTWG